MHHRSYDRGVCIQRDLHPDPPEIHGILQDTVNKHAVRILLECILVEFVCTFCTQRQWDSKTSSLRTLAPLAPQELPCETFTTFNFICSSPKAQLVEEAFLSPMKMKLRTHSQISACINNNAYLMLYCRFYLGHLPQITARVKEGSFFSEIFYNW